MILQVVLSQDGKMILFAYNEKLLVNRRCDRRGV